MGSLPSDDYLKKDSDLDRVRKEVWFTDLVARQHERKQEEQVNNSVGE